jgi:tetratricopeptide (TPR) repeat protein
MRRHLTLVAILGAVAGCSTDADVIHSSPGDGGTGGSGGGAWGRVSGQVALAETLAFAGQNDEAKKTLGAALGPASNDTGLLVRASALLLVLKDVPGALAHARRAVEVSQGGDAAAHAALGEALAASGDPNGAGSEFARAAELEPENAAFRRRLEAFRPKKGAKAA